jgi:hypothetical protein
MGIISKQIHKQKTNRLIAPARSVTQLKPDQVLMILRQVIEHTPQGRTVLNRCQKLMLGGGSGGPWKVFFGMVNLDQPTKITPEWTVFVTLQAASSGEETMITTQLAKWKTREGKLVRSSEFQRFIQDFDAAVTANDPNYRQIDNPTVG